MQRTPLQRRTPLAAGTSQLRSNKGLVTRAPLKATSTLKRTSSLKQGASFAKPNDGLDRGVGLARTGRLVAKPRPKANAAQVTRWDRMREIGCIACRMNARYGFTTTPLNLNNKLEMQHLLSGGRRRGHDYTVCLCEFHHQGKRLPHPEMGYRQHAVLYGPSFGRELTRFRQLYGREDEQLVYRAMGLRACNVWRDRSKPGSVNRHHNG